MKFLPLPIFILLLSCSSAYTQMPEYQYPELTLELEGDKIILKQKDNIYSYPAPEELSPGITKVLQEDVNGDGKREYIVAAMLQGIKVLRPDGQIEELPEFPYAVVLIVEQRENELDIQKQMILGCNFPDFELTDVNKDGIKDVIATGWEPKNWSHLKIASWQDGKYVYLWDRGEHDFAVEQSFEINEHGMAQINIGYPDEHGYNPEIWETWIWDGRKFKQK